MNKPDISKKHAVGILRQFDIEPQPADRLVETYCRRHRELHSSERRAVADLVFGVLRWRRRLEGMLVQDGVARPSLAQLVDAYGAWNSQGLPGSEDGPPKRFPGGAAAWRSFPDYLYRELMSDRGEEEAASLMVALNRPAQTVLRTNTVKTSRDDLRTRLAAEGVETELTKESPYGLILATRVNIPSLASFKEGLFEVQDEASQLAAMAVGAQPEELILDACAGSGGKSLFLAMMMQNRGKIVAHDSDERKLKELAQRAGRAGASCIEIVRPSKRDALDGYRGRCDAVLIDAPCSGTGTIRRSPDIKWRLNSKAIDTYARTQNQLLDEYAAWCRPGGRIVYVTCSILRRENEAVVAAFGEHNSAMNIDHEECLNIMPSGVMDGFFVCVMRRAE